MDNTSVDPDEWKTLDGSVKDSIQRVNGQLKGMLSLAEEGDSSGSSGQQMMGPEEHSFWRPFPGRTDDNLETSQMPNKVDKTPIPIKFLNNKGWFNRDISIGNMGFAALRDCQSVLVKLHDFNLSKHHGSLQAAPHWTGTLPFVAIGLLEAPKSEHRIGFDVEALMWSLLWIARLYGNGKVTDIPLNKHPLKNWFLYPESALAASKTQYLTNRPKHRFTNNFYEDLEDEMKGLAWKWSKMLSQQSIESQEHEEEVWFSEKPYGEEGFDEIQAWMVEHKWDK